MQRVVITGGAGFVGSFLAKRLKQELPHTEIICFDNLHRRGSENNIAELTGAGIIFQHGDVRVPSDLESLPTEIDLLIEASAEPSVHAGQDGSPAYLLDTNFLGAMHCLELCRQREIPLFFLSTSRVYAIDALKAIQLEETDTAFRLADPDRASQPTGLSSSGVTECFPVDTPRSLYGFSKLAAEYLIQEYCYSYGVKAIINRCGVIAGPGQFGKVDQGVFSLWLYAHLFQRPLVYQGFGGKGKQVRDLLHPEDLFQLLRAQLQSVHEWSGAVYNIGGGTENAVSLAQWTEIAASVTGTRLEIGSKLETANVDVPYFVADNAQATQKFSWRPQQNLHTIATDIYTWALQNKSTLEKIWQ